MLFPVLMLVNAGAINTIRIAMIPITTRSSSSVKAKRSRSFGNVKALSRSRCLSLKLRRSQGNTNLRIQYRLEIVNLESGRRLRFSSAATTNEHESARIRGQRSENRGRKSKDTRHRIGAPIEFVKSG